MREAAPSAPRKAGAVEKLWVVEELIAKASSWAQNSAPRGWDDARTAEDAPWEAPVEAEPQKPARESAPPAPRE